MGCAASVSDSLPGPDAAERMRRHQDRMAEIQRQYQASRSGSSPRVMETSTLTTTRTAATSHGGVATSVTPSFGIPGGISPASKFVLGIDALGAGDKPPSALSLPSPGYLYNQPLTMQEHLRLRRLAAAMGRDPTTGEIIDSYIAVTKQISDEDGDIESDIWSRLGSMEDGENWEPSTGHITPEPSEFVQSVRSKIEHMKAKYAARKHEPDLEELEYLAQPCPLETGLKCLAWHDDMDQEEATGDAEGAAQNDSFVSAGAATTATPTRLRELQSRPQVAPATPPSTTAPLVSFVHDRPPLSPTAESGAGAASSRPPPSPVTGGHTSLGVLRAARPAYSPPQPMSLGDGNQKPASPFQVPFEVPHLVARQLSSGGGGGDRTDMVHPPPALDRNPSEGEMGFAEEETYVLSSVGATPNYQNGKKGSVVSSLQSVNSSEELLTAARVRRLSSTGGNQSLTSQGLSVIGGSGRTIEVSNLGTPTQASGRYPSFTN